MGMFNMMLCMSILSFRGKDDATNAAKRTEIFLRIDWRNPCHSRGINRNKLKGTNGAKFTVFRRFSLIFADFRFSWELQHIGGAGNRRKPQETADFRRKPFVPFSLSLLIPPWSPPSIELHQILWNELCDPRERERDRNTNTDRHRQTRRDR